MIRSGEKYLESLRDDREIWIDGERVRDVTRDPRFRGAADVYRVYRSADSGVVGLRRLE